MMTNSIQLLIGNWSCYISFKQSSNDCFNTTTDVSFNQSANNGFNTTTDVSFDQSANNSSNTTTDINFNQSTDNECNNTFCVVFMVGNEETNYFKKVFRTFPADDIFTNNCKTGQPEGKQTNTDIQNNSFWNYHISVIR